MSNILLVSYGFSPSNLRLQPWRYVYEMAKRLPKHGYTTTIVTNTCVGEDGSKLDVVIKDFVPLSPFARKPILRAIEEDSPDVILWPLGSKSIAYVPILRDLKARIVGYIPGPILDINDFIAASRAKLASESSLAVLWAVARVLRWGKIMASCCERFVVLSEENRNKMIKMGIDERRIHLVTAGCDPFAQQFKSTDIESLSNGIKINSGRKKVVLYMGWPTKVRGIDLLLNAFALTARQSEMLHLKILARGDGTKDHKRLHRLVDKHPLRDKITIIRGFLSKEDVLQHIAGCDFGVLPFIQVPADRPLSFLEFFAAGKPVVSTDASGIPELIGTNRGIISNRNSPKSLAAALTKMANSLDKEFLLYHQACKSYIRNYPDWDESTFQLAKVLEG